MSTSTVHPVDEILPAGRLATLGLQHVLVMSAGAIAAPLIVGSTLHLGSEQVAWLISADLLVCGIVTLIQSFGMTTWFGIKLPVKMGVTFAAVGPMVAMTNAQPGLDGARMIFGAGIDQSAGTDRRAVHRRPGQPDRPRRPDPAGRTVCGSQLSCLLGKAPASVAPERLRQTVVDNLRYAAGELKAAALKLLIEPINTFVLDDIHHAQRMEGELAATMQTQLARIGHIQPADNPGRNAPGSGEINYPFLFTHLDRIGFSGWVGCESKPAAGTEAGLGWRQRLAA